MRTSQYLLATVKETPADAELMSHKLMLRAGMIRKLSSGLYTWLPLGLRVLQKVEKIVREEMNAIGALEILMPSVQPAELWIETGRWEQFGPQLLCIKDRHQRDYCYGPTHEEVITDLMRRELKSYKQLPICLYQIQTKFRDEIRPRFGVMRAREFLMKDAYSFNLNHESLTESYNAMYSAYSKVFTRLGLKFRAVLADTGAIGGSSSHEFHVLADSGEDAIAYCDKSDYAANVEMATAKVPPTPQVPLTGPMKLTETPNIRTVAEQATYMGLQTKDILKTLLVKGREHPVVALLVRGDHTLNEIKAQKHPLVASPLTMVDVETVKQVANCGPGFVGPMGLKNIPIVADPFVMTMVNFSCGANAEDKHYIHVNWGRDLPNPELFDLRTVMEGDLSPDGKGTLSICRGIEVGHIFKLGDKYSQSMNATVLDETGRAIVPQMGSYGIGVSRIVGAAIEQNYDDKGIIWPDVMAPFTVVIIPMNYHKAHRVREACEKLYNDLQKAGVEVLLDDRKERPGVMFADMELIGIPHRLVVSEKGLDNGTVEYKHRTGDELEHIALENCIDKLVRMP